MLKSIWLRLKNNEYDERAVNYLTRRFPQIVDWNASNAEMAISVESEKLTKIMAENFITKMEFDEEFQCLKVFGFQGGDDKAVDALKQWMLRHKVWLLYKGENEKAHFQKVYEVAAGIIKIF